ncbi:solute carrier family 35 (UDP-sugar transporter), member A1/2/3 [Cryptococcus deuterogattii 99/473]|uniref:Unplaced genomic scaffold supercont1.13, whole genome shotgun sequence n=1 Tax=Cryptococcus deuterogattii Ram5 TaxID=1296110 RepID=A0A0D0UXK9_9TREE|nr:solute carrier family 35 (UDP-sugar transporter), member A1/2/3 [Cryptococcus deuterogattii Ram5]KIY58811.1 solute carrier family 35 (UDP-sugar transporter), member A1/2/3 [Cryptococcus deuterogattii 99/473]
MFTSRHRHINTHLSNLRSFGMAHRTSNRSPSGLNRRPTDRSNSQSGSMQSASSPVQSTFGGRIYAAPEEDRGLIMRDRSERDRGEKDWADEKGNSMGKTRGMDVGVTRPKRRLSSLPNLLVSPPLHRAMSSTSVSSPPQSPIGQPGHNPYHSLQQQTFHNQKAHGSSTANNYSSYRSNPPKLDDKVGMVGYATAMAAASREREGPPSLWGIELKWISLITLALQNAFLTIIMHYSRISTAPNRTYSAAAAVLLNELLKGGISVFIALKRIDNEMIASPPPPVYSEKLDDKDFDRRSGQKLPSIIHPTRLQALSKAIFSPDCYKLSVPAILYVIQNNLQYVAASNLDVATFQVTYQMKILTTAFFSVLLLRKRLSRTKWASLVLLAVGVGIVQIQSSSAPATSHHTHVDVSHEHQLRSEIPVPDEPIMSPERVMHPIRGFVAVTLACMTSGLAGVYFEFILKSSSGSSAPDLWTFGGLITALVIRYSDNIIPSPPVSSTRKEIAVPGSPISTSAPILGEPEKPSRASSVINLLGLGSNHGSRKPSISDIKSYASSQLGLSSYPVSASASAPGTPAMNSHDYAGSGRSSPAGVQASHGGSGAGFGRGSVGDKYCNRYYTIQVLNFSIYEIKPDCRNEDSRVYRRACVAGRVSSPDTG